ncbi:MAG: hypothetical protein IJD10_07725, partial [Clostridia bacterium]|nr:hypothetical protein [Clostridia bacterium]
MKSQTKAPARYLLMALSMAAVGTVGQLYAMLLGYDVKLCVYKTDYPVGPIMGWILFAFVLVLGTAVFFLPKEKFCRPVQNCKNGTAFLASMSGGAVICASALVVFDTFSLHYSQNRFYGSLWSEIRGRALLTLSLLVGLLAIPAGIYLILSSVSRKKEDHRLAGLGFFPVLWVAACLLRIYFDRNAALNDPLKTLLQVSLAAIMLYFLGELRSRVGKPGARFRFTIGLIALVLGMSSSVSTLTLGLTGAGVVRGELMMAVTELLLSLYIAARLIRVYDAVPGAGGKTAEKGEPPASAEEAEETVSVEETPKTPVSVIVLAGQSNAVGVGHCAYLPRHFAGEELERFFQPYEKVKLRFHSHNFKNERFQPTTVGCSEENRDTFGPEVGIADALTARCPDREIYIVKCAFGATSLYHDWAGPYDRFVTDEDGTARRPVGGSFDREAGWCLDELISLLEESLAALEEEGYAPEIRAFLWMQGESDADTAEHAAAYGRRYRHMIDAFGERFAPYLTECRHIDGGISEMWEFYREINAFKREFAEEREGCYFLDTIAEGLTTKKEPDGEA